MRNIETKTEVQILVEYLNIIAEHYENKKFNTNCFLNSAGGVIGFAEFNYSIDRFQAKLLQEQAKDIATDEYTRFCDPEIVMNEIEHNHED